MGQSFGWWLLLIEEYINANLSLMPTILVNNNYKNKDVTLTLYNYCDSITAKSEYTRIFTYMIGNL